jgi:prepilin-type N-terminal cleavage/methylation domain-containing protein
MEKRSNAMKRLSRKRTGFTLIELTVVIAIVGILVTLTAGSAVRYFWNAKQRATEAVLQTIDGALSNRVNSFWRSVKPPVRTRHSILAGLAGTYVTNENQSVRLRRAELIAKLEAMRGDFPQQFADFLPASGSHNGIATSANTPPTDNVAPVASRARAAIELEYRRLTYEKNPAAVPNNAPRGAVGYSPNTQIAPHDHQTESAACLYLMLKVGSGDGSVFDMNQIPSSFIKDTDEDGVPEIVDAWGTPVRFYRWPTDLSLTMIFTTNQLAGGSSENQNSLDSDKLLALDVWVAGTGSQLFESNSNAGTRGIGNFFRVSDPTVANRTAASLPTYPIIVSAGPDATTYERDEKWQAFGLKWGDASAIPTAPITTSWPPVEDLETRCAKVSQELAGSYPGQGAHVDNILSRAMRAGQEAN